METNTLSYEHDALVIGAGFAGIAAATQLAALGRKVKVLERHDHPGGRARVFHEQGFTFDMGPSWYWMPDVFEAYFAKFGSDVNRELDLVRLDPSYTVWFKDGPVNIAADLETLKSTFDSMEAGAGAKLQAFLDEAEVKYEIGMNNFVRKPAHSVMEFATWETLQQSTKLTLLKSFSSHARNYFTDERLLQIIEFPVLFLGAKPEKTPALYSLMNYADTVLGTWYPMGGMHEIVRAMVRVAEKLGVEFQYNADVAEITDNGKKVSGVRLKSGELLNAHSVVAGADYHHVEQSLLPAKWRRYDADYWESRVMSPSSLLFYVGVNKRVPNLQHHNLFFDTPFGPHAETIYDSKTWPEDPLFYVSAPSTTDSGVAPKGCENLFFLIPLAPGLDENPGQREAYFEEMCDRLEGQIGMDIRPHIVYKRGFAHREFQEDYRAFKGNAYGLANTLKQTAFWKPRMKSKLPGLYFTGQLTTPGPGVPPSLISGEVAGVEAHEWMKVHTDVLN
jgi:phytoene desaturase